MIEVLQQKKHTIALTHRQLTVQTYYSLNSIYQSFRRVVCRGTLREHATFMQERYRWLDQVSSQANIYDEYENHLHHPIRGSSDICSTLDLSRSIA